MRWLPYFILAYATVGLQIGLGPYARWRGAGPDLVLLAVVFIALNAPREPALLGCFMLGAMQDLVTLQPLGLYALSYSLVAWFVLATAQVVYKDHPLTHFSLALVGGLMTAGVLMLHGWVRPIAPRIVEAGGAARLSLAALLLGAVYTAVLAPFVLGVFHRLRRVFAFQPARMRRL